MCERGEAFKREFQNNNQEGTLADGDSNANDIQKEDGGRMADSGSLSHEKVIIWGPDSHCDDPELAEFEMLECQELEAYLVEDGEDFVGLADREDVQVPPLSCSKDTVKQAAFNMNSLHGAAEQESESTEVSRTEMNSDADVFVSCLSTISTVDNAMDTPDRAQTADSSKEASVKACQRADDPSLTSRKSTIKQKYVDMNLNSAVQAGDFVSEVCENIGVVTCRGVTDECSGNNNQGSDAGITISERETEHKVLATAQKSHDESSTKMNKSTQADEATDANYSRYKTKGTQLSLESKAVKKRGSFDNSLKKQNSFDKSCKKQPSFESTFKKQHSSDNTLKKQGSFENSTSTSLERRKPWGSPSRPAAPTSPKTTSSSPKRCPPGSPAKVQGLRALSSERSDSTRSLNQTAKLSAKTSLSGIPKPIIPQQKDPEPTKSSPPHKPKNIRPKIITYIRKSPQAKPQGTDGQLEASTLPLTSYPSPPANKDLKVGAQPKSVPVLCSSNSLFDKYRQEMQKTGLHPPGTVVTGIKPPSSIKPQRLDKKSESFHEDMPEKCLQEPVSQEGDSVYRSPRALRPQLGLGAVARQPAAKTRLQQAGQRSSTGPSHCGTAVRGSSQGHPDPTGELKRSGGREIPPKSVLFKPGQSGLRPPGFSTLPAARLATFGFVRSSSVSSVSSNQSNDSGHHDPCRMAQHPGNDCDDTLLHKPSAPPSEASHVESWSQPPNAPNLQRRSLPPHRGSPLTSERDMQKDKEAVMLPKSSPKRVAAVPPKPQSPARGQAIPRDRALDLDRALIQQLRERCEQQARQLQSLQAQFKKVSICLDVFGITTQHFCHKSESAIVKERELSLELARIRDEVGESIQYTTTRDEQNNVAHWEQLQQEKQELECHFETELQGLRAQQQRELVALEERLKAQHMAETENLQEQQQGELEELRFQQQEQFEEMRENHEASLTEMEMTHNATLATLQEEHARTVKNLKMAHEQQSKSLEEEFEKIRLSLQDQVDTLTFQNRTLRDRAKRFEEALRRSTDEQIVEALEPYKHIEEDLKSLKDVLEMKNQQIHQQDLKISELEKIAEKNVYLEERLQVLQQQNEDLKIRIDKNIAVSRQLSEENANLQVHVEKESNEKKRLSRTNEELLWRLQTGELSPRMSPTSSPIHRPPSGPCSPARPHSYHQ